MDKNIFVKMLEDAGEELDSRAMVLQLVAQDVTDYERGKVMGKIEMIGYLMRELVGDEDEANII